MSLIFLDREGSRRWSDEEEEEAEEGRRGAAVSATVCVIGACVLAAVVMVLVVVYLAKPHLESHVCTLDAPTPASLSDTTTGAASAENGLHHLEGAEGIDAAVAQGSTVVMFHALWCGACRATMPIVELLAPKSPSRVLALESQVMDKAIQAKFGISAFPTFVKLEKGSGKVLAMVRGGNVAKLKEMLEV